MSEELKKDFYGREIIALPLVGGGIAELGDIIRWKTDDSDDFTTWTFTGIYKSDHVIYLGGGVDFGHGIGQKMSIDDVIQESEENDTTNKGVHKVGLVGAMVCQIQAFNPIE